MSIYKDGIVNERNAEICLKMQKALRSSPDCKNGQKYLRSRGISKEIINDFSIGWFPVGAKLSEKTKRLEPLRGRVIFPVKDEYGDIVCFSGRVLKMEDGVLAKWWNESYAKSFFLYGIDVALENIIKKNFVIVVEGQMDAITCHKFGLNNTVAIMGSSFTFQHIAKLIRFTNNFVLMFDGDSSGRASAKKITEYLEKGNKEEITESGKINFIDVNLKYKNETYDPDDFLNKFGVEMLKKEIRRLSEKWKNK